MRKGIEIRFFILAATVFCINFLYMNTALADSGRGRHKQLYVVPAPGAVTIDGNLDDWDCSGQIQLFVQEATRSTQSAGFAVMYDDKALYISGEVNDPNPMMNRHDPRVMAHRAWDADACQFRLVVDGNSEYPVKESTFKYRGKNAPKDTRDDIVHLLLWHYTDEGTSHLQMHQGMGYRVPEGLEPEGLVPSDKFEGAYRKWENGRGYTFEYRIPWTTLRASNPPKAGDVVGGTMQMHWARPDGLSIGSGRNVARDIIGHSGVPYQSAETWGRMIFADQGNVSKERVLEGVPRERPLSLEFEYELPDDGQTTIQLIDEDGIVQRILVAQQERPGGVNVERWDGMDNHHLVDGHGGFLPAGSYDWRGVFNSGRLKAEYRFSVHNSGQPPYRTDDGTGGWGGDHGVPRDVIALQDGMLFCWEASEAGFGLIRTDINGRKRWGSNQDAMYLAVDGKSVYIAGGKGFVRHEGVRKLDIEDARPQSFADGSHLLKAPPGGNLESDTVTGLTASSNTLYVSFGKRDRIAVYDLTDASLCELWELEAPGRLALRPDGSLIAISGKEVVFLTNGIVVARLTDHIDEPTGVAVSDEGIIYVANCGALQLVSVFSANGDYIKSIGRKGGRPAMGVYDPSGIYMAGGIDIDAKGRLWVAESADYPKRISLWDVDSGKNLDEFFGAAEYFAYGYIDPDRPEEIYAQNMLWAIDWDKYRVTPKSTIWRKSTPDMAPHPRIDAYGGLFRMVTADNGQQFGWGGAPHQAVFLYMRDGDIFRPIAGDFNPWGGSRFNHDIPAVDEKKSTMETEMGKVSGNTRYIFWQDANDDGRIDSGEFSLRTGDAASHGTIIHMDKDLSLWLSCGRKLTPIRVTDEGRPIYDLNKAQDTPLTGKLSMGEGGRGWTTFDDTGAAYTMNVTHLSRSGSGLTRWKPDGDLDWRFPDILRWRDGRTLPTSGPGRLWGATQLMGVGGEFLVGQNYFGTSHIFRRDGMYIGAVLGGGPSGKYDPGIKDSRYNGQSEGQGGSFVKLNLDGKDRYFMIQGSHDVRVWEITGLDTLRELSGGTYEHSEARVEKAKATYKKHMDSMKVLQPLHIVHGRKALEEAKPVGKDLDDDRGFEVRAAYDDDKLYFHYKVEAPHGLVNGQVNPNIIFRGGNCLDIQIATDQNADPKRKKPVSGDLRLLVTRKDNKPFAMLYRPKVKDFKGEQTVLFSPTGEEPFDDISEVDVDLEYEKTSTGFTATVTVPLATLGFLPKSGDTVRMDFGYIFGNATGSRTAARAYLHNNSFSANVVDDIPNESRLEPGDWGEATFE